MCYILWSSDCGNVFFTALSAAKKTVLRMSWWGGDTPHKAILNVANEFMKVNPDIEIETEYSALNQYKDKFMTQLYGGANADIMAIDQPWVANLIAQGDFFLDLSKYGKLINFATFDRYLVDNYCKYPAFSFYNAFQKKFSDPIAIKYMAIILREAELYFTFQKSLDDTV